MLEFINHLYVDFQVILLCFQITAKNRDRAAGQDGLWETNLGPATALS